MTDGRRAVGAAAALLVLPAVAAAHGRSLSYSRWTLGERGATVELRLARIELNAAGLPSRGPRLAAYATERLRLLRGGRPCVAGPVEMRDVPGGWVALSWANACQGGGPLASALARSGRRTALIEREHVGGTCINVGCTPTKTMVASARVAYLARRGERYGVRTGPIGIDMATVRQRKRDRPPEPATGAQHEGGFSFDAEIHASLLDSLLSGCRPPPMGANFVLPTSP